MHIIIGMPGHIIIQGMPAFIIAVIRSHISFIMSIVMPSIGLMVQVMPADVISQVMPHIIIGIGIGIGIGIMPDIIGIMFGIMAGIIGIMFGIMPDIIGIMFGFICIAGIMVSSS